MMIAHLWEKTMPSRIQLRFDIEPIIFPIITREMENEESDLFKEYFFDCMYLFCLYIFVIFI